MIISFTEKLIYLQKFFKNRYSQKNNLRQNTNISKSCLLIQDLNKILKRNKIIWLKKFLKYTKKYIKHSEKHSKMQIKD